AEAVPKTKKLLKFRIDTGIDIRTIVSGIAEHFAPEELVGRQVQILANLAPREIKGVTSHGMILMTERADGKIVLLTPTEKVPNGAPVN
ncbi:MAG: methionine--tRNA ligase, partial [Alistipes sp.]|nr:methionine--tRNA ligase [Alistipes sp.]